MSNSRSISIWNDLRPSALCYSASELLQYYRTARWLVSQNIVAMQGDVPIPTLAQICSSVEQVFCAMTTLEDYRALSMVEILRMEYCDSPLSAAEKISKANVSKTTYYTYLREGIQLFESVYDELKPLISPSDTATRFSSVDFFPQTDMLTPPHPQLNYPSIAQAYTPDAATDNTAAGSNSTYTNLSALPEPTAQYRLSYQEPFTPESLLPLFTDCLSPAPRKGDAE